MAPLVQTDATKVGAFLPTARLAYTGRRRNTDIWVTHQYRRRRL